MAAEIVQESELTWSDLAPLVQGLEFASRPLSDASRDVRERFDIGHRGTMVLNQIAAGRVYPHEIAAALNVGRSLMSADLARAEKAGLIKRTVGRDRRRVELALTELGTTALLEVKANLERLIRSRLAARSKSELRLCTAVLQDLIGE